MLLDAQSWSGSVLLGLGSDVWGQVQDQGLIHSQGIKTFPGGSVERIPAPSQGTTLSIITKLTSQSPNRTSDHVADRCRKGLQRSSLLPLTQDSKLRPPRWGKTQEAERW